MPPRVCASRKLALHPHARRTFNGGLRNRAGQTLAWVGALGLARTEWVNPDRVQASQGFEAFATAFSQTNRLVCQSESRYVLKVGQGFWPFPVPIVKHADPWLLDTKAGKAEILNRRVGKNELSTLQTVRAYVDAQRDYAGRGRDADEVLEYAQRISSAPGHTDGLY